MNMNICGVEVYKGVKKFQLTFLCRFPILLSIFLWKLSLVVAFSHQKIVTYGLSKWRLGKKKVTLAEYESCDLKDFFGSEEKCDRCPLSRNRASAQPTMYNFGAGKTGGLHLSVKQRGLGPGAKVMNEKNRGEKAELITALTTMLTIQEQSVTNYAPQCNEKSTNYAYQDWFLTQTIPWTMPCLGRCQELNSMDNCGIVLRSAFGPFWFMFIDTVIKVRS